MSDCLIAESDPHFAQHLARALRDAGWSVEVAFAAFPALELIRLRRFDAIVTDTGLPGITGRQLLRAIRRLDPAVLVIALTQDPLPDVTADHTDAGLGWVRRPADPAHIVQLVRQGRR